MIETVREGRLERSKKQLSISFSKSEIFGHLVAHLLPSSRCGVTHPLFDVDPISGGGGGDKDSGSCMQCLVAIFWLFERTEEAWEILSRGLC